MVKEFMLSFGQRVLDRPQLPPPDVKALRAKLNKEEGHDELLAAETIIAYFDAVVDSLYVVLGAAAAAGINASQLELGFAEVHRSNMSKLWTQEEWNARAKNEDLFIHPGAYAPNLALQHDRFWIVRDSTGKVRKSPGYSPANLAPILDPAAYFYNDYTEEETKLAGAFYTIYCHSVGGKAFNGDPLPKWSAFVADPSAEKQARGWLEVARQASTIKH